MDRTLYCLVAAMTIGAGFLHWCQPGRSTASASGTTLTASSAAWTGLVVDSGPRPGQRAVDPVHYHVDRTGHVAHTDAWLKQSYATPQGPIRIALQVDRPGQRATVQQWDAMGTLVRSLMKQHGITISNVAYGPNMPAPPVAAPTADSERPELSNGRIQP